MVGALQQHHVGAGARRCDRRRRAGRAAAHHQHVAVAEHRDGAGRFVHHAAGPCPARDQPAGGEDVGFEEE